jgi:hypothetical protein
MYSIASVVRGDYSGGEDGAGIGERIAKEGTISGSLALGSYIKTSF